MHTYTRHHRHYNTPILSGWVLKLWQKPRGLRKRYLPAQILFLTSYQTHKKMDERTLVIPPQELNVRERSCSVSCELWLESDRIDSTAQRRNCFFWQTTVRRTLLSHSRKSAHPNILSSSFSGINQLCRVNFILAGLCFLFTVNVQSQKRRSSTELESVVNWKTEPVACVCVLLHLLFFLYLAWCLHTCWIQIAELFVSEKPHQKETRTRRQQQQQNLAISALLSVWL
jgi:hypothetical protein